MRWSRNEIDRLSPILEQISRHLAPVDGKEILVLCSSTGEVAFWLGEMMEQGKVTGLESDPEALSIARRSAHEMGLDALVEFLPAEMKHIPLPEESFDGLVSEFIAYPTSRPTEIGEPEMARLIKPGGKLILTDVIVTAPLPQQVRDELQYIGLDYLCEATQADFLSRMHAAGMVNIELLDLSSTVQKAWEIRRSADRSASHRLGYSYLLDDSRFRLGKAIFYLYACGEKPKRRS